MADENALAKRKIAGGPPTTYGGGASANALVPDQIIPPPHILPPPVGYGPGEIPSKLYHVAGPSFRGGDLKPPINFLARGVAQDMFRQKWPEGDPSHIQNIFFHDSLEKAQRHVRDFGGTIYEVDPMAVRDLHIDNIEPEWTTRYMVPQNALRKLQ